MNKLDEVEKKINFLREQLNVVATHLILLTEGTLVLSHIPSFKRASRISHANIPGSFFFNRLIEATT